MLRKFRSKSINQSLLTKKQSEKQHTADDSINTGKKTEFKPNSKSNLFSYYNPRSYGTNFEQQDDKNDECCCLIQ